MEQINQTVHNIRENAPTRTFFENHQISTPTIRTEIAVVSREQHVALFALINKTRMCNGWGTATAKELDATIQTWAEAFNQYKIPIEAYNDLYFRAFEVRQLSYRNGKEVPKMSAELLVSGWTGEHGLRSELEQKRINEKRYLPDVAASQCPRCLGFGRESVYDEKTGRILGVRLSCDHRPLIDGEYLHKKLQDSLQRIDDEFNPTEFDNSFSKS